MYGAIASSLVQHSVFSIQHFFPIQHSVFSIQHFFLAVPSQEDVFKSIQTNVDGPSTGGHILPILLAGGGVIILLALFTQRQKRETSTKALNHPGKLFKEVLKVVPLRRAEVKQLKLLAESNRGSVTGPVSPLTLLVCPSLFARSLRNRPLKTDSKALAQLAKRVGLVIEARKKPAATTSPKPPAA